MNRENGTFLSTESRPFTTVYKTKSVDFTEQLVCNNLPGRQHKDGYSQGQIEVTELSQS